MIFINRCIAGLLLLAPVLLAGCCRDDCAELRQEHKEMTARLALIRERFPRTSLWEDQPREQPEKKTGEVIKIEDDEIWFQISSGGYPLLRQEYIVLSGDDYIGKIRVRLVAEDYAIGVPIPESRNTRGHSYAVGQKVANRLW